MAPRVVALSGWRERARADRRVRAAKAVALGAVLVPGALVLLVGALYLAVVRELAGALLGGDGDE